MFNWSGLELIYMRLDALIEEIIKHQFIDFELIFRVGTARLCHGCGCGMSNFSQQNFQGRCHGDQTGKL